jgi:hypothetical protein
MTQEYLESVRQRLLRDPEIPEGVDLEVLAATPILWCGWECDTVAVLYRILPDGEQQLHVLDSVGVSPELLLEKLEERVVAYREVIGDTEAFVAKAKGLPPAREWRWICTVCRTEGRGDEPKVCPNCGADDAWYSYNTSVDDPMSARERMRNLGRKLRGEPDA